MMRVSPIIRTMMLVTSLSMSALCRANADTIVTLEGVTFADGATAAGYFVLNVDGYMESAEITTSAEYRWQRCRWPGTAIPRPGAQCRPAEARSTRCSGS